MSNKWRNMRGQLVNRSEVVSACLTRQGACPGNMSIKIKLRRIKDINYEIIVPNLEDYENELQSILDWLNEGDK